MADPQLTPEPLGATPAPLPPTITWAGMTRARFAAGRAMGPPRVLVLHATAGSHPGDYHWLRKGGGETPDTYVSCHYYIDKGGRIAQLVRDHDAAYHCGASSWAVDGQQVGGSHAGVARLNWLSIGCELENRNTGADPYPAAQVDAAVALFRWLAATYQIPRGQVVRHRDIAPERKTDPAGFPWPEFVDRVFVPGAVGAAGTPILGGPSLPATTLITYLDRRAPHLSWQQRQSIVCAYTALGELTTIGNVRPLAQAIKEASEKDANGTYWAFNSRRFLQNYNPAGLGATNDGAEGAKFYSIAAGIAAQFAHLLCYAAKPGDLPATLATLQLLSPRREALAGTFGLGSAPTWEQLNGRWAYPGTTYGQDILRIAGEIAETGR